MEVRDFLHRKSLDLFLVQETHLHPGESINAANYRWYHDVRATSTSSNGHRASGGTGILIKNSIEHSRLPLPPQEGMEATAVKIFLPNNPPLIVVSVYLSPTYHSLPVAALENLLTLGNNIILAGDFNAHHWMWYNRTSNTRGYQLKNWAQRARLKIIAPTEPTHYMADSRSRPSVIDFALARNIPYAHHIEVLTELSSDHLPVILTLNVKNYSLNSSEHLSTNWENFTHILDSNFVPSLKITSTNDVDETIGSLSNTLLEAYWQASKPKTVHPDHQLLSKEVRSKIRLKNRLRRIWQSTRDPSTLASLRSLQNEIKKDVKEERQSKWNTYLASLTTHDNTLWRAVSRLRKHRPHIPPLNGNAALTDQEKADAIADHFSQQFTPNEDTKDDEFVETITTQVEQYLSVTVHNSLPHTTPSEILAYVRKLKLGKTPGLDSISNRIIKNSPHVVILQLCILFNKMLDLQYFPACWKTAVVVPIPKPGLDAHLPVNYRPISLLSSLSKIFEFVLLCRLKDYCRTHAILIDEQYGFRSAHSTQHQLLRVVETVQSAARNKLHCGAIFLDVAKAFDRVWQVGLIHKLMRTGLPSQLIHLINSYLTNRFFRVRVNSVLSAPHPIQAGVPQGSLLGPYLFNLYVNDIPKLNDITLALYADDTAVIATNPTHIGLYESLNLFLILLERWLVLWRIKVNAGKSAYLPFTMSRSHHPDLMISGEPIPWVQNYKYLGVYLDSKFTWIAHFQHIVKKVRILKSQLGTFFARKSHLTPENKLLLYKTVVRPTMTYGSVIWGTAAACHLKKLQVFQNYFLRRVVDAPYYVRLEVLHSDLKIPSVFQHIKKDAFRFFQKALTFPNASLHEIEDYSLFDPRNRKRPRTILARELELVPKRRRLNPSTSNIFTSVP